MEYKQRAISDQEKKQRYQHIINTAERLLSDAGFHEITMAKIASEAGLAKGTLFIYFQTKEDVFLSLTEQKIMEWSSNLGHKIQDLINAKIIIQIENFIDLLINSFDDRILVKLFAILDDTLEQNIDFNRAVQFKSFLKEKLVDLGKGIEAILPVLHKGDGVVILNQLFICFIGAYKVSNPSSIVKQVVQKSGLEIFNRDFIKTLREMATYHIIGYIAFNKR
jgi:TetR/AcrR family transcriptional regulator